MSLSIRKAQPSDAPKLSKLICTTIDIIHRGNYSQEDLHLWKEGYSAQALFGMIQNRNVYIAHNQDHWLGTYQLNKGELKGVYVHPDAKGQGVGRAMIEKAKEQAYRLHWDTLSLTSNPWTTKFYEKVGFEKHTPEKVYWLGSWYEEWRMVCSVLP